MNLRSKIRAETHKSEHHPADGEWEDQEFGPFLTWYLHEFLGGKYVGLVSTTVDAAIPDDEELKEVYTKWQIERGD